MGSNASKRNRIARITAEQTLVDGLRKHAGVIPGILVGGTWATTGDLVATLQERIDSAHAVISARASWLAAVYAERAGHARTANYVSGVRTALLVGFAGHLDALADFGLTEPALHVRTPEETLAVTAKIRATRAARHTMGAKQKRMIRGSTAE
jgi:hypothetical protein